MPAQWSSTAPLRPDSVADYLRRGDSGEDCEAEQAGQQSFHVAVGVALRTPPWTDRPQGVSVCEPGSTLSEVSPQREQCAEPNTDGHITERTAPPV